MGAPFPKPLTPLPRRQQPCRRWAIHFLLVSIVAASQFAAVSHTADLRQLLADPEFQIARSSSGQFIVASHRSLATAPAPSRFASRTTNLVELTTDTLVVSCETIKSAFLRTLQLPDSWRGHIHVILNPRMTNGQPAFIGARPFIEGWQYQVDFPTSAQPIDVVRGIVHVLLLELANRNAGLRSAEIPLWLSEGLTQHLVHSSQSPLVMARPRIPIRQVHVGWDQRLPTFRDPLQAVRDHLQNHAALSFTRMGEIEISQLSDDTWQTFQTSAQLFVGQLLHLPRSREMLVNLLLELPHHLNWQIAFLKSFRPHFPRMLDAEKWWSVVLVHFTGLDSVNAWSVEIALNRLHDALHPPVLVAKQPKDLPERTHLSIQEIIKQFDYLRQRILLQELNRQLGLLRPRMPLPVVPVLDGYRSAIEDYLNRRDRAGMTRSLPGLPPTNADRLVAQMLQRFNQLDSHRSTLAADHPERVSTAVSLAP